MKNKQFMKNKLWALPLSALVVAGCQSSGESNVSRETNLGYSADTTQHLSTNVYLTEFNSAVNFAKQASELEAAIESYCQSDAVTLDQLKSEWQQTMTAWMALQGQERGPAKALEESWNVQFWPDKKNTTGLKMSQLNQQDKRWTQQDITLQSVTVQGLGALEWSFYDKASPLLTDKESGCKSVAAIAQNLAVKSSTIASAWQVNRGPLLMRSNGNLSTLHL